AWGILGMASAGAKNFASLFIIRLLLGAFEAGLLFSSRYYLTLWYTRKEYSKRLGYLYIVSCVAGVTGGIIAYGISQISTERLHTWQWMFIIEGAPCIIFAFITFYFLPDHPGVAKFLTKDEKKLVVKRITIGNYFNGNCMKSAFTDWKTYFYIIIYLTSSMAGIGITLTLPSIVDGLGAWDEDVSLALTTPPYALACVLIFVVSWSSGKTCV
ncbi:major facilitator superfamily domain-containing protein, partial [Fennellomyces sp. T-0311]